MAAERLARGPAEASAPRPAGPAEASAPRPAGPAEASAPRPAGPAEASAPRPAGPAEASAPRPAAAASALATASSGLFVLAAMVITAAGIKAVSSIIGPSFLVLTLVITV